ncbi:MAG: hypothetical protein EBS83_00230 [Planctomycetia bacterium]|nr:hypothetical protein [Planctomycetia bacterium]
MMHVADWHLARSGNFQLIGSARLITGESFRFLPLFCSHDEAQQYCRQSGLWHQGIRPRHNYFVSGGAEQEMTGFEELVTQAVHAGAVAVGVFIGFNDSHESCWEYFRASNATELLPESERPV